MKTKHVSYVKADDDKLINEACIRWVKKIDECLEICVKSDGCAVGRQTHRLCNFNNPDSYAYFQSKFAKKSEE